MGGFVTWIGAEDGIYRIGSDEVERCGLQGRNVWAIHAFNDADGSPVVLAGTYGDGMYRSDDGGTTWEPSNDGLTASAFRTICTDPLRPGAILAGTEPARIFRSDNAGRRWNELSGILAIDGVDAWYLPYSPRAGAIRNVYAPSADGDTVLASVEVGGLLRSRDGGETWTCEVVGVDTDIHHITGHPDDPALLYASLGYASLPREPRPAGERPFGGIARSRDGGLTWEKLEQDYTRATIIPRNRTDLLLAGPAPRVGEQGRIVVSHDGGDSWQLASDGIDTPMPDMVELFVDAPDGSVWAICSGGRLLRAEPGNWRWTPVLDASSGIDALAVAFTPPS